MLRHVWRDYSYPILDTWWVKCCLDDVSACVRACVRVHLSLSSAWLTAWTEQQKKNEETPKLSCGAHFRGIHMKHTAVLLPEDAVYYSQTLTRTHKNTPCTHKPDKCPSEWCKVKSIKMYAATDTTEMCVVCECACARLSATSWSGLGEKKWLLLSPQRDVTLQSNYRVCALFRGCLIMLFGLCRALGCHRMCVSVCTRVHECVSVSVCSWCEDTNCGGGVNGTATVGGERERKRGRQRWDGKKKQRRASLWR